MDPKVCDFFNSNQGPNCNLLSSYCQLGFFQDATVSDYMNTISNTIGTISFCDAGAQLNVYNPCGSVGAFQSVYQSFRNQFNFSSVTSQYTLSSLNDCLQLAIAAPTMAAIQQGFSGSTSNPNVGGSPANILIVIGSSLGILAALILAVIGYKLENPAYMIVAYILLCVSALYFAQNVA